MDTSAAITRRERRTLLPLFHFVVGDLSGNSIASELDDADAMVSTEALRERAGDARRRRGALEASNAVNVHAIGTYLAYLVAVGFLPSLPLQLRAAGPHYQSWTGLRHRFWLLVTSPENL